MTDSMPTPTRLWKQMTSDQRITAARAFWRDDQATDDQIQAVMLISQQKKFRPKTVVSLDEDRKARHLASLLNLPESLAARALVIYHLAERRPMMAAFLDALGIAHEDGLIKEDAAKPDPEKLQQAATQIADRFPPSDVALYLNTLLCQDPETWGGLRAVVPQITAGAEASAQRANTRTTETSTKKTTNV